MYLGLDFNTATCNWISKFLIQFVFSWFGTPLSDVVYYHIRTWSHFALKVGAALSPETLISYHIIIRRHSPEDYDVNLYRRENLKSPFELLTLTQNSSYIDYDKDIRE
jgi:hypothetical protein